MKNWFKSKKELIAEIKNLEKESFTNHLYISTIIEFLIDIEKTLKDNRSTATQVMQYHVFIE
jgi:hypothetical protein